MTALHSVYFSSLSRPITSTTKFLIIHSVLSFSSYTSTAPNSNRFLNIIDLSIINSWSISSTLGPWTLLLFPWCHTQHANISWWLLKLIIKRIEFGYKNILCDLLNQKMLVQIKQYISYEFSIALSCLFYILWLL